MFLIAAHTLLITATAPGAAPGAEAEAPDGAPEVCRFFVDDFFRSVLALPAGGVRECCHASWCVTKPVLCFETVCKAVLLALRLRHPLARLRCVRVMFLLMVVLFYIDVACRRFRGMSRSTWCLSIGCFVL